MDRRRFVLALLAGAFAGPLAAAAQQAGKVPRIGFLSLTSPSDRPPPQTPVDATDEGRNQTPRAPHLYKLARKSPSTRLKMAG